MPVAKLRDLYIATLPENPSWITGGVLPKSGITLMGGYAKIGKTFHLIDMAYTRGSGGVLWGLKQYVVNEPVPTLYLENEVGPYEFQRRLMMRPEPPTDNLYFISKEKGLYLDTQSGADRVRKFVEETDARVLIVDPISRCIMGDENSNTDINKLFMVLDGLIADYPDLSIVLSHHFGKPPRIREDDEFDPLSPYNFRGASKWFDAPDTLITMSRQESRLDGEWWRTISRWTFRQAPPPEGDVKLAVKTGGVIGPPVVVEKLKELKGRWQK